MTRFNPPLTPSVFAPSINMNMQPLGRYFQVNDSHHPKNGVIGEAVKINSWGCVSVILMDEEKPRTFALGDVVELSEEDAVNIALRQACAELDEVRLQRINEYNSMRYDAYHMYIKYRDAFWKESEFAYHLAAALLAGQMAARL